MQKTAKGKPHSRRLALCQVLQGQSLGEWLPTGDLEVLQKPPLHHRGLCLFYLPLQPNWPNWARLDPWLGSIARTKWVDAWGGRNWACLDVA